MENNRPVISFDAARDYAVRVCLFNSQFTIQNESQRDFKIFFLTLFFSFKFAVNDSPYSERFERKDSIRRFFREQFQNDKKSKEVASASSASTTQSDAESVKSNVESTKSKSSAYRLFRTVSFN